MINMLLSVLAVMFLAYSLWKLFDIKSGATPLISMSVLLCVVIFLAMAGQLMTGVYISYGLSAAFFLLAIKKKDEKGAIEFFSLPVLLFGLSAIFMLTVLSRQKPMMSQWDEFSFWGTARKLIFERRALYTFYKSSMIGSSMPPALPVLCFYFGYGFAEFCEWARFFAYDLLFLACFSAVVSIIDRKNQYLCLPVFFTLFLLPYFFGQTEYLSGIAPMYITLYSEIPLATLFTGAVAVYCGCAENSEKSILSVLPIIAVLTFAKDMGLALSCIALFIIFWDMVATRENFHFFVIKGIVAKIISALSMLVVTGFSYFIWSFHMSRVMQRDATSLGGESEMSAVGLVVSGIKELLGLMPRSEKFTAITKLMAGAFFNRRISMLGSGLNICILIFIVFAVAFLVGGKKEKTGTATMYLSALVGFVGYYVFHLFLYVYIFKDNAYQLTSYNRYIYPYYFGWLVLGIICLAKTAGRGKFKLGTAGLIAIFVCVLGCFERFILPQNTFMDINHSVYTKQITVKQQADFLRGSIGKDDVIFLLSEEDSGQSWFIYTYQLTDNLIYQEPDIKTDEGLSDSEHIALYQKKLSQFMREKNVTHFMVDYPSERMCENIGGLFDVNMGQFGIGSVGYYKVIYTDDSFYCQLVKGTGIN